MASSFPGFTEHRIKVHSDALKRDIEIYTLKGGSGPGLLLLHGYPQTSYIWRKIAPRLSESHTVVIPDLRGYGQSEKPRGSDSHVEYSKREMANDQVQVMKHFNIPKFYLVGHDRGGRVAHRLALDHPDTVIKMMTLDIAPTLWMYEHTDLMFATGYWHWFFLIQPSPDPENLILGNPSAFWGMKGAGPTHSSVAWTKDDVEEYQKWFFTPEGVHGSCEDYRAAATIDLEHDRRSLQNGQRVTCPTRVLWGTKGMIEKMGGMGSWEEYVGEGLLSGKGVESGHYIPEERPGDVEEDILDFMR